MILTCDPDGMLFLVPDLASILLSSGKANVTPAYSSKVLKFFTQLFQLGEFVVSLLVYSSRQIISFPLQHTVCKENMEYRTDDVWSIFASF